MKGIINKIFLITVICIITISQVKALENPNIVDFSKKGTIEVTLKQENNRIEGAELTLYQIAFAKEENHNLAFEYKEGLENCQIDLTNLNKEYTEDELESCITNDTSSQKLITNQEGIVKFENLDLGLYIIKQTNQVKGYSEIDSFLVMLPKEENNSWSYSIKANPKTEIYQVIDLEVVKVWNTTDTNLPENIKVELYNGNKLVDTIVLNKENNWTYTWERIAKSDEYQVKEKNVPDGYTDTYRQEGNKFIITNTKTLVQTGANIWLIELLTISGLILIITGYILKRKGQYE